MNTDDIMHQTLRGISASVDGYDCQDEVEAFLFTLRTALADRELTDEVVDEVTHLVLGHSDLPHGLFVHELLKELAKLHPEEAQRGMYFSARHCLETAPVDHAVTGDTSDGHHTFAELYHQRAVLFAALINGRPGAWKSRRHADGTMFDADTFIVGIGTPQGQYAYHYNLREWELFDVAELDSAPVWDGHTSADVERLLSLENSA